MESVLSNKKSNKVLHKSVVHLEPVPRPRCLGTHVTRARDRASGLPRGGSFGCKTSSFKCRLGLDVFTQMLSILHEYFMQLNIQTNVQFAFYKRIHSPKANLISSQTAAMRLDDLAAYAIEVKRSSLCARYRLWQAYPTVSPRCWNWYPGGGKCKSTTEKWEERGFISKLAWNFSQCLSNVFGFEFLPFVQLLAYVS